MGEGVNKSHQEIEDDAQMEYLKQWKQKKIMEDDKGNFILMIRVLAIMLGVAVGIILANYI
ncbi:MAG: hypothetical protein PHR06_01155 [Candidatus Cloacimonetes bacterium]|nr:hypothetical protein [Candidatus Cloacimonadota bacterium]